MQFSESALEEYERILERYPSKEAAVMAVLELAQKEFGAVTEEVERYLGELLEMQASQIHAVTTFYTMFKTQPTGRHHIQVCRNLSCSLLGAEHILEHLQRILGIKVGETTHDGNFTLSTVECLGSCGTAPVMQVDETYYESLTPEVVDSIIAELKGEGSG